MPRGARSHGRLRRPLAAHRSPLAAGCGWGAAAGSSSSLQDWCHTSLRAAKAWEFGDEPSHVSAALDLEIRNPNGG